MSELWQRSDRPFTSGEERMWRHLTVAANQVVPVTEPLLTREEAANDPEVQRMVFDLFNIRTYTVDGVGARWVTDDE